MAFNEEHAVETYKSLISLGTQSLKTLQLLNGGAIVALLAYVGRSPTVQESHATVARNTSLPILFFVLGLVAGTLAHFTTYFTQFALYQEGVHGALFLRCRHTVWLWATIILALGSLGLFSCGALSGVGALANVSCQ